MKNPFILPRNLHFAPIVHHEKVKSIENPPNPRVLIRPVKIPTKLPSARSRSFSANSKFRDLFQIPPKNSKISNSKHSSPFPKNKNSLIKDLNDFFLVSDKENQVRKIRNQDQNKSCLVGKDSKVKVNRILLPAYPNSPLKDIMEIGDNLVTFRPELTPSRKMFRFPRNVFCVENKKKS